MNGVRPRSSRRDQSGGDSCGLLPGSDLWTGHLDCFRHRWWLWKKRRAGQGGPHSWFRTI